MRNHQYKMYEDVEPHLSGLYNTALRMSGNVNNATILVKNTLCKAIESSESFQHIDNPKVWIFKMLMHVILTTNQVTVSEIINQDNNYKLEEFYLFKKLDKKNSLEETASIIDTSLPTVISHLYHGR